MAVETKPFDAAEYLDDPASRAELLADALESGDSAYISHAISVVARARSISTMSKEARFSSGAPLTGSDE